MPTTLQLTEARIRVALMAAVPSAQVRLYDSKVPGLLLWRRGAEGHPRWYVFRRAGGRMRRLPVGEICQWPTVPVEQARVLAARIIADVVAGVDVVRVKAQRRSEAKGGKAPLAAALERHLSRLRERQRTPDHQWEVERITRAAIAAGIVDLAEPSIAAKAESWLSKLDVAPLTRHRYRQILCAVGKTALRWWAADVLPRDPFLALTGGGAPMPAPPVFTPAEAVRLVSDEALALPDGLLWAFLLYTGTRYREATWCRWDRLDLDGATFQVIPPDAVERSAGAAVKRNKTRTVTLQAELVALLRPLRPAAGGGFLVGDLWRSRPHVYSVFAFRDHLAALGIPLAGRRIHCLRHTHACLAIAAGEDSLRLRLSMGHAGEAMSAHYGQQAMRWRGLLHGWRGAWKLRDPVEVQRLTPQQPAVVTPAAS